VLNFRAARAPAAAASAANVNIIIQAWDGPSVDTWLRKGGAERIKRSIVRAEREGAA
jgi:hypothetical protein